MRTPRSPGRLAAAAPALALALALVSPARLAAQLPLAPGAWQLFEWYLGAGPVDGGGFSLTATRRVRVRLTDVGFAGDAFTVLVNGAPLLNTPAVTPDFTGAVMEPNAAWADPRYSKAEFELGPGSYLIGVSVRETPPGLDVGEGYLRADPIQAALVPEPATVGLLATGLAGLLGLARAGRRRG